MKAQCVVENCDRPEHARGLCTTHYPAKRRTGELQLLDRTNIHSLTQVNIERRTALCSICGPVDIRLRSGGRGSECMTARRANLAARNRLGSRRQKKYGLTDEAVDTMLLAQHGRCAICPDEVTRETLHVDHDHRCCPGKYTCGACIRGLLCRRCNLGLGYFKDDPERLAAAQAYLVP